MRKMTRKKTLRKILRSKALFLIQRERIFLESQAMVRIVNERAKVGVS